MWKCIKCETINEDSIGVCTICGMSCADSKKIELDSLRDVKSEDSDTVKIKSSEILKESTSPTVTPVVKSSRTPADYRAVSSTTVSDSVRSYGGTSSDRKGVRAMEIALIVIVALLLLIMIAVVLGIFVIF